MTNKKIVPLSVTQINNQANYLLKSNFSNIAVRGEISSLKTYPSGFTYITIKDQFSDLRCISYPGVKNVEDLSIGKQVYFQGDLSIYVAKSTYQFVVKKIQIDNDGLIWKKYLELKKKLEQEGLFSDSHKKEITKYPFKIGIISSGHGAVIHDMLNILKLRAQHVKIIIIPTKVQGDKAVVDIIESINQLNKQPNIDAIIIARGGGSFEDLNCFNNEKLARSIFDSEVPIISAIGHQTDYTIVDYVSDIRASTPTAAAQYVIANFDGIKEQINNTRNLISHRVEQKIELIKTQKKYFQSKLSLKYLFEKVKGLIDQKNNYHKLLLIRINNLTERYFERLDGFRNRLKNNEISNNLNKGYSIVYDEYGSLISDSKKVNLNQKISIKFLKGKIGAKIIEKK